MRKWEKAGCLLGWGALLLAIALQRGLPASLAESLYARRIFPHAARALAFLFGRLPFSVAEGFVLLLPGAIIAALYRLFHSPQARRGRIGAAAVWLPALVGYLLLAFSLLWGANYRRPPLARRMAVQPGGTPRELRATTRWLLLSTAQCTPPGPDNQPTRLPYSEAVLNARIDAAYARSARPDLFLGDRLGQAKPICFSGVMGRLGLSGVYSPLTGEPNYNRLLPDSERVFAIAHEKAHQRGIAPENEANFAAFLALRSSPDRYLRYCGCLNAAGYALGAVARTDPEAYPELAALLRGRPAADAMQDAAFWRRYRGPIQRVSTRVNDLYLRANRVPGGVRSYDAVTDLLIGFWRQEQQGRDI